ncbi:MAG: hypothetical protein KatS3mg002_0506 [Candidatus Woesearchaeota archaeon]|nr:MAG: hypothetical protein KatS3mg002_0506 [Candidatus Woesearchaeota archaeon]
MKNIYYTFLIQELQDFESQGQDISMIKYIPDFFKILSDMLDYEEVDKESRILINAALGYFVSPDDVLPDDIYGPEGYVDDVFLCTYVIRKLYPSYKSLMKKLWNNNVDFEIAVEESYIKCKNYLMEKNFIERILKYCGLE